MKKKKHQQQIPYKEMTTWELIRKLVISKLPRQKEKISEGQIAPPPKAPEENINYIAIVLDGVVEDVMRAENRLAALLLSNPEFVEFDPKKERPQIGQTNYSDGKFSEPEEKLLSDEELAKMLKSMEKKDEG